MEGVKGSSRKTLIGGFYAKNWQHGKLHTVKYFERIGVPATTEYRIIKECDEGRPMERKPGSGRPPKKMKEKETLDPLPLRESGHVPKEGCEKN